jgi:hypothetical protein
MSDELSPAEVANNAILNATYSVLGNNPAGVLDSLVVEETQHYGSGQYQLKAMKPGRNYVEFVLGDTTTNKIVTFFRKYNDTDWRIYIYGSNEDFNDKKAVEVDLRKYTDPNNVATPGIVKIVPDGPETHNLDSLFEQLYQQQHQPGGRRRRRTRARKTRKRKTRRSRR